MKLRVAQLLAFGFLQGASIGPLIQLALQMRPIMIAEAFVATTLVFVCFSAAAYFTERRSYLYLGGFFGSALTVLLGLSLMRMLTASDTLFSLELYCGLALFVGFVMFDTQMIIEKRANGDEDFVWHAVELFIDFVAIFVRILIILMRKKK